MNRKRFSSVHCRMLTPKRPLNSVRSTSTLADQFSLHNFSVGKRTGNPMGDGTAMMPVETQQGGIHYLSTTDSDPEKMLQVSQKPDTRLSRVRRVRVKQRYRQR